MSTVVVACGALALHVRKIAARRGWDVEVRPVPPELHNRPERIRAAVEETANGDDVVVAYAHCGADLGLDAGEAGEAGSRTEVYALAEPPARGDARKIEDDGSAAEQIVEFLAEKRLI